MREEVRPQHIKENGGYVETASREGSSRSNQGAHPREVDKEDVVGIYNGVILSNKNA